MTFNTGNNVPSTDPRDLYDNAENLDKLVNGADPFYADRKGVLRESWAGMENTFDTSQEGRENAFTLSQADKESRFQAFLVSSGYVSKGDYAANVVLEKRNEYVAVDAATTGTTAGLYRPNAEAVLPLTLTGVWSSDAANLVLLGDDVLRQELAGSSPIVNAEAVYYGGKSLAEYLDTIESVPYVTPAMFGAVTGLADQSAAINAALATGKRVIIDEEYYVNARPGIVVPSNRHVTFIQGKGRLRALALNQPSYNILSTHEAENVLIEYPDLVGDRDNNTATGEWGHGLVVSASSNVRIIGPRVVDCFGDGIYVGRQIVDAAGNFLLSDTTHCSDVWLQSPYCANNRRNNISIISADGLWLTDPVLIGANGTDPQAGLDLEPNSVSERMSNVFISNVKTLNNVKHGVVLALRKLTGASEPVSIFIDGVSSTGDQDVMASVGGDLRGSVHLNGVMVNASKKNGLNLEKLDCGADMDFLISDVRIRDCNKDGEASSSLGAAISYWRNTSSQDFPLGGAALDGVYIDSPGSTNGIYFNDASSGAVNERALTLSGVRRVRVGGSSFNFGGPADWRDEHALAVKTFDAAESQNYTFAYTGYLSKLYGHTTKPTVVTLPPLSGNGVIGNAPVTLVSSTASFLTRFTPGATDTILIAGKAAGASIETTVRGASITLRPMAAGWEVVSIAGTWT